MNPMREASQLIGVKLDPIDYDRACERILDWADAGAAEYVCIANVHVVMEARDSADYGRVIDDASMVTTDGVPLVWALRLKGVASASRVYGPELMQRLLSAADRGGYRVGLFGGDQATLDTLNEVIARRWPEADVVFSESPPFRPLSADETSAYLNRMRSAGVQLLFVGLGCPKQESWMHEYSRYLPGVMLGVGAAFDFIAGTKKTAPPWLQRLGLEWAFRLATEPSRLWRRYLKHNPRFLMMAAVDIIRSRLGRGSPT